MNIFIDDDIITQRKTEEKEFEKMVCSQYRLCKDKGLDGILSIIEDDYNNFKNVILKEKWDKIIILRNIQKYLDDILIEKITEGDDLSNVKNDLRYIKNNLENLEDEYYRLNIE